MKTTPALIASFAIVVEGFGNTPLLVPSDDDIAVPRSGGESCPCTTQPGCAPLPYNKGSEPNDVYLWRGWKHCWTNCWTDRGVVRSGCEGEPIEDFKDGLIQRTTPGTQGYVDTTACCNGEKPEDLVGFADAGLAGECDAFSAVNGAKRLNPNPPVFEQCSKITDENECVASYVQGRVSFNADLHFPCLWDSADSTCSETANDVRVSCDPEVAQGQAAYQATIMCGNPAYVIKRTPGGAANTAKYPTGPGTGQNAQYNKGCGAEKNINRCGSSYTYTPQRNGNKYKRCYYNFNQNKCKSTNTNGC